MDFIPPTDRHYCLDPWCENPDPDLIPDALCGCHILTETELEERKKKYLQGQHERREGGDQSLMRPVKVQ
ncbi:MULTISPECIES: hypothetical protein [unclassified Streptomyces]|uniref:hypothetical protein n=1 Tax=unclassified Streptomyces TaxID=2593676 RepID=UPI00081ED03D|nr:MULTISPECIES: hypothetical protein [unclassified Streptomyces]MYZ40824.1 hypothetical protein [Streptomyces sp. SID4917]SCG08698.1 hypothetical protein GA0115259_113535 [Streptomyces sp. MnatMP-M17]